VASYYFYNIMGKLFNALLICSDFELEGRFLMSKNKLGKSKYSINQLDANKTSSGVSDTEMSIMYNLSNMTSDITDVALEEKKKLILDKAAISRET
jgi:hypothetical protein